MRKNQDPLTAKTNWKNISNSSGITMTIIGFAVLLGFAAVVTILFLFKLWNPIYIWIVVSLFLIGIILILVGIILRQWAENLQEEILAVERERRWRKIAKEDNIL